MLDSVINPVHIMIILAVVLVLFGPKRLPEMGQKVGQALRDFRSATSEIRSQTGIDDIAGSVNDIKSSLSLSARGGPQPGGGAAPAPPTSCVLGDPVEASAAVAAGSGESPPNEPSSDMSVDDQPTGNDTAIAGKSGEEGGIETFGALKRGSRS